MKFTIRDLFWLVIVVAVALGWYVYHRETMRTLRMVAPMYYDGLTGEDINTNNLRRP
jgi:hypothetical protein